MSYLAYALAVVFFGILQALWSAFVWIDHRLAKCEPGAKYGTYVWHMHSLFVWRYWATHTDARDLDITGMTGR